MNLLTVNVYSTYAPAVDVTLWVGQISQARDGLKDTYCPEPPLKVPMLGGLVDHDDAGVYWNDESESWNVNDKSVSWSSPIGVCHVSYIIGI